MSRRFGFRLTGLAYVSVRFHYAMNISERLQRLDTLIVENTKPPVTAILRNELSLCLEEAEAHSQRGDKQDKTLANQVKTIERLMKENADVVAENNKLKDKSSSEHTGTFGGEPRVNFRQRGI